MIRSARDDDFPTIAAITNHYIATTSIHFAYEPVSTDAIRSLWLAGRERYPWFVAEAHGTVVGYAKAGIWRDRAAYAWTTEIGLYIAPDAHRRGFGRALYRELLAELEDRGFRSAIAGITLPNDPSVAFHEAFGFGWVGTVRDAGYKLGAWHDLGFWQKRFTMAAEPPRGTGDR
jgi:phosphinothricin acetyltransferase